MLKISLEKQLGRLGVNIDLTLPGNGVTALFGRSGAGKTSIINMIAGLDKPDAGCITINGRCVFDGEKGIDTPPEKRRFGYVFQDARLFPHLSVKGNLMYGMKRVPEKERYISFDQVVALLDIGHLHKRHPATLSGGEKQRVAIGRSLLTSPVLLLMDEPLASLDIARKNEVLPFINRLSGEFSIPILYVTHAMDEMMSLADTLVFLSDGKCLAAGPVEEICAREDFEYLTGDMDTGMVMGAVIESHDPIIGLTWLRFQGGSIKVPLMDVPAGERVRVRIHPRNMDLGELWG